jgi:NADH:ubiquinone oxidoreductase subunit 5 (subunit L)/multisubunit Na+/H+ antiporter MnhA subunit
MILEAGEKVPVMYPLLWLGLFIGTLLTGAYTGRLFFGVFHGPKRFEGHIHPESGLMLWPLVPLAIGAVVLGYIEWPGQGLSHLLAETVGESEPFVPSINTLIAGALGIAGFVLSPWFFKPQVAVRPAAVAHADGHEIEHETEHYVEPLEPNVGWSDALADACYGIANVVARVQSGQLGRYIFVSVLGLAAILLVTLGFTQSMLGAR